MTTATGTVGSSNLLVNFTSSSGSGLVSADPLGQATVFGGTGNTLFTQLTVDLESGGQLIQFISLTAINGATFEDVRQFRLGGGDILATAAVPEPGSLALIGLGLFGLTLTRRRKR